MLNLIKSIIITMISLVVTAISYIRGPILLGLIVGATIMAFAGEVNAATAQPIFIALSFSETFGTALVLCGIMGAIILFIKEAK